MADKNDKQLIEKHGKIYEPGTVLFREGEVGKRIYVVNEGRIKLTKRVHTTDTMIEVLGPGEFCGELALVMEAPHPVTATVLDPARLLIVDAKQFETMVRSNTEIALRMLRKLAGRLTQAQFRIVNYCLRSSMGRLLHQLKWEVAISSEQSLPFIPEDLAEVLSLEKAEVVRLIDELKRLGFIAVEDNGVFSITDRESFERYLSFIELRDRFENVED